MELPISRLIVLALNSLLVTLTLAAEVELQYTLDEEMDPGSIVGNLKQNSGVLDLYSQGILDQLRFGLLSGEHQTLFSVDETSGIMYVRDRLDRDSLCSQRKKLCVLSMEAGIVQPTNYFTIIHLDITIRDINDNRPRFSRDNITLMIPESASPKSRYMLPTATDIDSGDNGLKSYHLLVPNKLFSLSSGTAGLSLIIEGTVDHEAQDMYMLQVVASDGGSPVRSNILTVHIQVIDTNDNPPVFNSDLYEVSIHENHDLYDTIVQVGATDIDDGQNGEIIYSLSPQTIDQYGDIFGINNQTGDVYIKRHLDYQMGTSHQIIIIAQDRGLNSQQAHTTVVVSVLDVNNHSPIITVSSVTPGADIGIMENNTPEEIVALVTIKDLDPGENGMCTCEVIGENFHLEPMYRNGYKLLSSEIFDREVVDEHQIIIRCEDSGQPALSSQKEVTVRIYDENDNSPVFAQVAYTVSMTENTTTGRSVIQVSASDQDDGESAKLTYSLEQPALRYLNIDPDSGLVTLAAPLDYEHASILDCGILVQDHGSPPRMAQSVLRIKVQDINDEAPIFIQQTYNFGTYENQANGTEIGTVTAVDRDSEPYNLFAYSLYGNDGSTNILDTFSIDPTSGEISSRVTLDREKHAEYHMIVMATNIEPPQLSSSVSVTIYIADKNDHAPVITFPSGNNRSVEVSVYSPMNYVFSRILAFDLDLSKNAQLDFSLINDHGLFAIDPMQGHLLVKADLHKVAETYLELYVIVSDEGSPPQSSSTTLQVVINRTVAFAKENSLFSDTDDDGFGVSLSQHEQILIILGAVTAVIVTVLVAAIVLVKKRQVRNSQNSKEAFHCMQRVDYSHKMATLATNQEASFEGSAVNSDHSGSGVWTKEKTNPNRLSYRDINQGTFNQVIIVTMSNLVQYFMLGRFKGDGLSYLYDIVIYIFMI